MNIIYELDKKRLPTFEENMVRRSHVNFSEEQTEIPSVWSLSTIQGYDSITKMS